MKYILLIAFVLKVFFLKAQVDVNAIDKANLELINLMSEKTPQEIEQLAKDIIVKAEKINYDNGIIEAKLHLANAYWKQHKITDGIILCKKILEEKNLSKAQYENAYLTLAELYFSIDNKQEALRYFLKCIYYQEDTVKFSYQYFLLRLGNIYLSEKSNRKAISFYWRAYRNASAISGLENREFIITHSLNSIGLAFRNEKRYDSAMFYFRKALSHAEKHYYHGSSVPSKADSIMIVTIKGNIGNVYFLQQKYNEAIPYFEEDYRICVAYGEYYNLIQTCIGLGNTYLNLDDSEKAMYYYQKAQEIAEKKEYYFELKHVFLGMSRLYEKRKDFEKSLFILQKSIEVQESLIRMKNQSDAYQLQIIEEINKKEEENTHLKTQNQQQKEQLIQGIILIVFALLLISVLIFLLVNIYRKSLKIKEQNQSLHLKNLKILQQKKEMEMQKDTVEKINSELNQLHDTKNRLLSILGHDLKGPIFSFKGLGKLIRTYLKEENYQRIYKLTEKIDYSAEQLYNLLNNLIVWASNQRGVLPYEPQLLNSAEIIQESISVLENIASFKEIKIKLDISKNLWTYADKNALSFIFRNLIHNAIKFSHQGGEIRITARLENEHITFSVSDDGVGMSQELIDKLFLQKNIVFSEEKGFMGTGLGLPLVRDFVMMNGGKIWVNSVLEKGTTFYFALPVSDSFLVRKNDKSLSENSN